MAPTGDVECYDSSGRKWGVCGKNVMKEAVYCVKCMMTYHISCLSRKKN